MADYWKSNERKFCDFCKCWISDNKASVSFHENGKRHKLNVAKRITDISRNSEKAENEKRKMDAEIRKMEDAAMRSYAKDIHSRGDFTARSINQVISSTSTGASECRAGSSSSTITNHRQVDPLRLAGLSDDEDNRVSIKKVEPTVVPDASLWVEGKSDDGYSYYWNVKTNESVWEAPKEGFLSWKEYQRINDLAIQQQEIQKEQDALKFRSNADEEVARYNRERLKVFRNATMDKQEQKVKQEQQELYKTEEQSKAPEIGQWQVVETKPPPAPIDLQLPKLDYQYIAPVVSDVASFEPPVKRFKEKTIESLDSEVTSGTSGAFKKRKFAAKGNARKRLDDD